VLWWGADSGRFCVFILFALESRVSTSRVPVLVIRKHQTVTGFVCTCRAPLTIVTFDILYYVRSRTENDDGGTVTSKTVSTPVRVYRYQVTRYLTLNSRRVSGARAARYSVIVPVLSLFHNRVWTDLPSTDSTTTVVAVTEVCLLL